MEVVVMEIVEVAVRVVLEAVLFAVPSTETNRGQVRTAYLVL